MGLRETKIGPAAIAAVRSFSQGSPQIQGIFEAQISERDICPRAKWRRERCWKPTFSTRKLLILLSSHFHGVRIPRVDPQGFSETHALFRNYGRATLKPGNHSLGYRSGSVRMFLSPEDDTYCSASPRCRW